jgi:predicted dehydrogenase
MLKVSIVGCGKVADQHVHAIRRIPDCVIAGLCDREPLMAKQLGERFGISSCFSDLEEMLQSTFPDVVHITTPPESHYSLAKQCLESGSHVYVEKPLTMTASEAESLMQLAEDHDLRITVGHNYQFTLEMMEMRRLVSEGYLGGRPIHLESYWSYDLGGSTYAGAFLGSRAHWLRELPGQLFHNIISHGIAKLAEFLDDDIPLIVATAHRSPELSNSGASDLMDELRVLLQDKHGTTAQFCFSTQFKPALNRLRIYGPRNSLMVDILTGTLVRSPGASYKSYLTYFIPPLSNAREHFRNARRNVINFFRRRLYQDFGMKELIERFYNSVRLGDELPIPYREIVLTARIMDEIFAQIYPAREQRSEVRNQRSELERRMNEDRGPKTEDPSQIPEVRGQTSAQASHVSASTVA